MPINPVHLVVAGLLAAFALGFWLAPREQLDTTVAHEGIFTTDTERVLATAVQSLKAESRLVVYTYTGLADVEVTRSDWAGLLQGSQRLSVPGRVTYHLNMADLGSEDVTFDAISRVLSVRLPPLRLGEIAMEPERARVFNTGLLTVSDDLVQALARSNFRSARRAFIKQAQQPTIVEAAREQAVRAVTSQLELPLRSIGSTDIRVRVTFRA
jgi:hypothetical protein